MNSPHWNFPEGVYFVFRNIRDRIRNAVASSNIFTMEAQGTEQRIDLVLAPKGEGFFSLNVPDGTAVGGNVRGNRSVDLQRFRAVATQVASGFGSFVGGTNNISSANYSFAFGFSNTASASQAVSFGNGCTSSAIQALSHGSGCIANGVNSRAGGNQSSSRSIESADVYSCGQFSALGDCQRALYILRAQTTDATSTQLRTNGSAASATNVMTLNNGQYSVFEALVVAKRTDVVGDAASFVLRGLIKRDASAATTAFVGTPTVTSLGSNAGGSTWTATATADTTIGALSINVVGEAGKTIRWVASVSTAEVVS